MKKQNPIEINLNQYLNCVKTGLAIVGLKKENLIEIRFRFDDYDVDVNDQLEIQDAVMTLTNEGVIPCNILVVPGRYGSVTKEAREMEMFSTKAFKNQLSLAIVVHGLPQRILGSLYLRMKKEKPKYLSKLFTSEKQALKWILKNKSEITVK